MSKSRKLIIGALTYWPLVNAFLFILCVFIAVAVRFLGIDLSIGQKEILDGAFLLVAMGLFVFTLPLSVALIVGYTVFVRKTSRIPEESKSKWVSWVLYMGIIAMPAVWEKFIWRHPE